jgi:hypothetical protein
MVNDANPQQGRWVHLFHRQDDFTGNFSAIESATYTLNTYFLSAGQSLDTFYTVSVNPSTTYSAMISLSRSSNPNATTLVDRRRPFPPPLVYTTPAAPPPSTTAAPPPATTAPPPVAPSFSDSSITTNWTINRNYSSAQDRSVSASPVDSYSIVYAGTGLNPTWLSINSSGQLSGIAQLPGDYTFRIRATAESSSTETSIFTLKISPVGKRNTGTALTGLQTAKRFTGTGWTDLSIMKRFTGTGWTDITNT